jgi:hypothetical protein
VDYFQQTINPIHFAAADNNNIIKSKKPKAGLSPVRLQNV